MSEDFSKILIKDVQNTYCPLGRTEMINEIAPFYTGKNIIVNIKRIVTFVRKVSQETSPSMV